MLYDFFFKHPHDVGQTYLQHFATAIEFGSTMIAAGAACVIHAFLPRVFERTASDAVNTLHARMVLRRTIQAAPRTEIDYAI